MKLVLSTHDVTLTPAIQSHIQEHIDKLDSIDRDAVEARVNVEHDNTKAPELQFTCSIRIGVPGRDLFAEDSESDLYAAIDLATKKIQQQIRKRHNKFKARNHSEAARAKRKIQESSS